MTVAARRFRALLTVGVFALAACGPPTAPPPGKRVEPTAAGLAAFIQRTCFSNADRAWLKRRAKAVRDACGFLDNGDCSQNADLEGVSWEAPTTDGRTLKVRLSWDWSVGVSPESPVGPPEGQWACAIAAPEAYGDAMIAAVHALAKAHPDFRRDLSLRGNYDLSAAWSWARPNVDGNWSRLSLVKHVPNPSLSARLDEAYGKAKPYDVQRTTVLNMNGEFAAHPWEFEFHPHLGRVLFERSPSS